MDNIGKWLGLTLVFGLLGWMLFFDKCSSSQTVDYHLPEPVSREPTWEDNKKHPIDTHTTNYTPVTTEEYLNSNPAPTPSNTTKHSLSDAFIASHRFVEKVISTPSTADFPWGYEEPECYKIDNNTFYISSYFDAQNTFGAMVRRTYHCKIIFKDNEDETRCEELWISD